MSEVLFVLLVASVRACVCVCTLAKGLLYMAGYIAYLLNTIKSLLVVGPKPIGRGDYFILMQSDCRDR